ncbi:hypothetical protein RB601_005674 [Gaeumannomyces tritici]
MAQALAPRDTWAQAIQALVLDAIGSDEGLSVGLPQPLHWHCRFKRIYDVGLSDRRHFFLSMPSTSMGQLLRCEQWLIDSEAAVLKWTRAVIESKASAGTWELPHGSPSTDTVDWRNLLGYIPSLLTNCSHPNLHLNGTWPPSPLHPQDFPYTLVTQPAVPSVPAAHRQPALSQQGWDQIDFQVGRLARSLSRLTSPNGNFGFVVQVLPVFPTPPRVLDMTPFQPHRTWTGAFRAMLELSLLDGQGMAMQLPYGTIRAEVERLAPALDKVTRPRLVVVNAASRANILVPATAQYHEASRPEPVYGTPITGFVDWSNCVFGDPLFMQACSEQQPSDSFLRGLNGDDERGGATARSAAAVEFPPDEYGGYAADDDEHSRWARLLLYSCYHHVTAVVREFYHQQPNSTQREMAARRLLADTLVQLSHVEGTAPPRPRAAMLPPRGFVEALEDGYE